MTGVSFGSKAMSAVSQLALAAILAQEEFGAIALCFTLSGFAEIVNNFGFREVLIRSQQRYRILLGTGMLLAVSASVIAGLLLVIMAPVFAQIWTEPKIVGPTMVLAAELPFAAAAGVISARLEIDMRFRTLALVDLGLVAGSAFLSIALALAGAGVYAFVVPKLVATVARLIFIWRIAKPRLQFRRARALMPRFFVAAVPMIVGAILIAVVRHGDYAILGIVLTTSQVGFYYFAFVQSIQVAILLNVGLVKVLLPALSTMRNDEHRQARAMLLTVRLLALPAAGMCVLQATLAGPFLRLLFGERWLESIPLLQLMSLAAAPTMACWPWQVLVLAQGRYWLKTGIHALSALGLLSAVLVGIEIAGSTEWDTLITITSAVALLRLVSAPTALWLVCRRGGTTFASIINASFRPALGAAISIALPGFLLSQVLPDWAMLLSAPFLVVFYAVWLVSFEWEIASMFMLRLEDAAPAPVIKRFSKWLREKRE